MTSFFDDDDQEPSRRPCVALMGEFSAGKSTLANILLEQKLSPVKVTATQLPPVWYTYGEGRATRIDIDGSEEVLGVGGGEVSVCLDTTRALRVYSKCEFLETCDLIDMPGSSDPNMTIDVWSSLLPMVDVVLWCSPATQAWRQSEAAMWDDVPETLHARSLLLLTRMDKVPQGSDRTRLLDRVRRETRGLFRDVLPVSLTDGQAAGEDHDKWRASGLETALESLHDLILEPPVVEVPRRAAAAPRADDAAPVSYRVPTRELSPFERLKRRDLEDGLDAFGAPDPEPAPRTPEPVAAVDDAPMPEPPAATGAAPVVPRRVVRSGSARTERPAPRRAAINDSLI